MHRAGLLPVNKKKKKPVVLLVYVCCSSGVEHVHTEALFFDVYVVSNFRDTDNNNRLSGFPASASTELQPCFGLNMRVQSCTLPCLCLKASDTVHTLTVASTSFHTHHPYRAQEHRNRESEAVISSGLETRTVNCVGERHVCVHTQQSETKDLVTPRAGTEALWAMGSTC